MIAVGTEEAARELKITSRTLRKWCEAGLVPGAKKIGKTWIIDATRLNEIKIPKMGRPTKDEDQENV